MYLVDEAKQAVLLKNYLQRLAFSNILKIT